MKLNAMMRNKIIPFFLCHAEKMTIFVDNIIN